MPLAEEEPEGLGRTFHEKVISLDTMELRLLLPTAVAIAVVVASAILVATRDLPWPLVAAGILPGALVATVPLPIAVLAGITLVIAWTFILSGALHAHLVARVMGVAAYALMGLVCARLANSRLASAIIVAVLLSVLLAAVGLYVTDRGNRRQAPHLHHRARLRPHTFGWVLLATTLIYGVLALSGLRSGRFAASISFQLTTLQFVLIPVLVLAGTDFAEWAEVASGRLGSAIEQLPRPALVGALAIAGAGVLAWLYFTQGVAVGFSLGTLVPVGLLALPVGGVGLLSLRRPVSTRVPFWALAIGAVLLYGALAGGSYAAVIIPDLNRPAAPAPGLPPLLAVTHSADPEFRVLVPEGWTQAVVPGGWMWSGPVDGRPARLLLLWGPLAGSRALSAALATPVELVPDRATQGWSASSVTGTIAGRRAEGEAWTRGPGADTWVLAGVRVGGRTADSDALFAAVRESWSPDAAAGQEGAATLRRLVFLTYLAGSGAASIVLLGLGLALLLAGSGEVATGGLFLTLCGLFTAGGFPVAGIAAVLLGVNPSTHAVAVVSLLFAGALATLAVVAATTAVPSWRLPKPILRLLLTLLLGIAGLLFLIGGVFSTAQSAGARFSIVAGVVLVAAMLWDVLMSGEDFTNAGGLSVPRHTRVLIYLGYTLMVVTAVLFLGSEQVQGGGTAGLEFASDAWPQGGIEWLGPPLLLTFFFVNLAAWRRRKPMGRADGLDQVDRSALDEVAG